jgi:methionine-rich copper-binding protein CopC
MKLINSLRQLAILTLLAVFAAQVSAHSVLSASLPGAGAEVSAPEKLSLTFNEPVRMLRLTLVHGASHNIEFGFQPITTAQPEFNFELPGLMSGAHTVTWTVIGSDGHTVSGNFNFTVNPQAGAAQSEAHAGGHHHH